jgi:hypothetical protein
MFVIKNVVQLVAILIYLQGISGSNIGSETAHAESFAACPQPPLRNAKTLPLIGP